jgi:hypothetical protein
LRAAERDDAQVELDLVRAERQRLEAQLESLKSTQDPEAATLAQLAAGVGKSVEEVRAIVAEVKAAQQKPQAPNPDRLAELLDKLDPHDYEGAVRAFDQAGYQRIDAAGQVWQGGRMQRPGQPQGAPEEIYRFLDTATSLADYEAKLRQVGLIEGTA